jgi:hypothetical protein
MPELGVFRGGRSPLGEAVGRALATRVRCRVCGFSEVRTDEVVDRGLLWLAECPRCEHRWTERAPRPAARRAVGRGAPAVAPAA